MPHPPPVPALPVSADHASHRNERPSEVIMARRQPSRTSLGECGRQDSNLQRPAFQAGALPDWSYDHASGRGWTRTSDLLFVRQALGLSELLARVRRWAELGSNQPPPPYQRGARPTELPALDVSPPMAASPASATQDPNWYRVIRSKSSWSAQPSRTSIGISGQGLEPRSPRSERDVLPLDDPEPSLRELVALSH
jgi:hypothetical protein